MRETQLVEKIRRLALAGPRDSAIVETIGDDCAVLRPRPAEDLVFTSDLSIQGRHFTLDTHSAADIGHTALARSLSDLAAMGAEPVFCLVSLALPAKLAGRWIDMFYKGLLALAARYRITLAGGDLARFDTIVADVVCCGRVPRGQAMLRSAAKPGHLIYVTGALGASSHAFATHRRLCPEPRIPAGIALRRLGVSSAMDLSDGLSLDLHRLSLESKVSADLDSALPIAPGATLEQALHGGEDYELLFTAAPRLKIPATIADLAITRIGVVANGRAGQVRFNGRLLKPRGFDHFDESSR